MRARLFGCFLLAAITVSPASAQTTPASPADPARLAAAREMIAASHVEDPLASTDEMAKAMFDVMRKQMLKEPNGSDPYYAERVRRMMAVAKSGSSVIPAEIKPQIMDISATIYAREFTLDELHGIAAFYRTPLGQSLLVKEPLVMRDYNRQATATMVSQVTKRMESLQPKMATAIADLPPPPVN